MNESPHLDFVALLFRLLKLGAMHDLSNEAAQTTIRRAAATLEELTRGEQDFYTFMLAEETVYVNGEPLKATRQAYENAKSLGQILATTGYNEVLIRRGVSEAELAQLASITVSGGNGKALLEIGNTVRARWVDPALILGLAEDRREISEQVFDTYATAVVLARRFQEGVEQDQLTLSRHIKRISQHIVSLSDQALEHYLAIALTPATPLLSRQLVHAAFTSVLVSRTITRDLHAMMRACYACMVGELGNPRVAGMYDLDNEFGGSLRPKLNHAMKERAPSSTAVMLMQMGYASEPALRRVVTGWEGEWLMNASEIGWPYKGKMAARPEAIIASVSRRFVAARHDEDVPDAVFSKLASQGSAPVEVAGLKLLCAALGYYPKGAAVRLKGGTEGYVLNTYEFGRLSTPTVIILRDELGPYQKPLTMQPAVDAPAIECVLHEPSEELVLARTHWRQGLAAPEAISVLASVTTPDPSEKFGTLEIKIPPELQAQFDANEPQ